MHGRKIEGKGPRRKGRIDKKLHKTSQRKEMLLGGWKLTL